ncbi:MAG: CopG family transcriptional regulator [Leptolyngbyaceae cyanobacterium MO_188.B28]|nr:CopG family transcriptional regulator [Leptolyngbyaceae cyanobacterium MO_188.B28]
MEEATNKVTIMLSDEEIDIVQQLAERDKVTPNEAIRRAILQAAYLKQQVIEGKEILVGRVKAGRIVGSVVKGVSFDKY